MFNPSLPRSTSRCRRSTCGGAGAQPARRPADEFQLYVFISHDLSVVRYIADEVMVMYYGEAVEYGSRDEVFSDPKHSYTKTLFAATPRADVESIKARLARKKAAA